MELSATALRDLGDQQDLVRIIQDEDESRNLLKLLLSIYDKKALASHLLDLNINQYRDKLARWQKDPDGVSIRFNEWEAQQIRKALLPPRPTHWDNPKFTFIDLFAGIGGIRNGFEAVGGKCVFTNEWDEYARRTYLANHYVEGDELAYFVNTEKDDAHRNQSFMDIQKITRSRETGVHARSVASSIRRHIPEHDVLLAGFPCQPFSLAGVSKKNSLGRKHGFDCDTQGTLFFDIEKILEVRQPKFFVLENVKNLKGHDQGNTFAVIVKTLDRLNYWIADISDEGASIEEAIDRVRKRKPEPSIIDAALFTPQHRERIVLVGVRKDIPHEGLSLRDIEKTTKQPKPTLAEVLSDEVSDKYTLTENLWEYLFRYALKHAAKGNGFGYGLVNPSDRDAVTRTLSARYHKDGSEILVNHAGLDDKYLNRARTNPDQYFKAGHKTPRRLTPRECARLMGFETVPTAKSGSESTGFRIPVSDTRAYRQFGNSVVVPVFRAVAELMLPYIQRSVSCAPPRERNSNG